MSELIEVLRRARARLAKSNAWTKGAYCRNAEGISGLARIERDAVCWCVIGAVRAEVYSDGARTNPVCNEWDPLDPLEQTLRSRGYAHGLSEFNDAQETVEPILSLYDETIARLEAGAQP